MALQYLTLIHVLISLMGIASGFGAIAGMLAGRVFRIWTAVFLATTVATSVTGFFFPFRGFLPAHGLGIISLVALAIAIYALYVRRLVGAWRVSYVVSAVVAQYLNFLVLIVQMFAKVPEMKALAPTQTEPPFMVTQLVALAVFVVLGLLSLKKFHASLTPEV